MSRAAGIPVVHGGEDVKHYNIFSARAVTLGFLDDKADWTCQ